MDVSLYLSQKDEKVLKGEDGPVLAKAMRLMVTLGELGGAEKLVPIKRSQVAGVSYKTSGDPTLELLEGLVKDKVVAKTKATLNPAGMDLERWMEMGVSPAFAEKQLRICKTYERLGVLPSCTCTPYLSGNKPCFREIVGFSESSAISYVNSVLGARTNRHGGLDALSAALVGRVPLMGYLLDENRRGTLLVKAGFKPESESDYAALGYYVGKSTKTDDVPVYSGLRKGSHDELKLLAAASAASGSIALFHMVGLTPEAKTEAEAFGGKRPSSSLEVTMKEIQSVYRELSSDEKPDLIAIGCPHCSLSEVGRIAKMLAGKRISNRKKFWVFTSPGVFAEAEKRGYIGMIQSSGADVFKHTCMVVAPIEEIGFHSIYTNSAKAAFYTPRMTKSKCQAGLHSLKECVREGASD
ncbi:MAG: mevalonate 5-phosphate dehydratase large subunit [Thermoproteota archaeon]|nr:mevalonate 5-phosphate dehydratase large subunit [Thermoproteota archaeon]